MRPDYRSWKDDPPEKVVNRKIIIRGVWKSFDILKGGEEYLGIAYWSSLMSDGRSGYKWFVDAFHSLEDINIEVTHWAEMFEGL